MGLIVDDHDKNLHGEARRESFTLFSDFGKEWHIELDWEQLPELEFVLAQLRTVAERDGRLEPRPAADTDALAVIEKLLDAFDYVDEGAWGIIEDAKEAGRQALARMRAT